MSNLPKKVRASFIEPELEFLTSRSGGPGGQHANKVETKVILHFDVVNSQLINEEQRKLILEKLASRITKEGVLQITASNKRSQLQNKQAALAKLDKLFAKAFTQKKKRKKTKPGKAANQKRLDKKKQQAEKKKWRKKI